MAFVPAMHVLVKRAATSGRNLEAYQSTCYKILPLAAALMYYQPARSLDTRPITGADFRYMANSQVRISCGA